MKFYDGTKRNRKQVFFPVWEEIFCRTHFSKAINAADFNCAILPNC